MHVSNGRRLSEEPTRTIIDNGRKVTVAASDPRRGDTVSSKARLLRGTRPSFADRPDRTKGG
jgi:hypothetical protein